MKRPKIRCPISGYMCIECPIYRGRHYYLCDQRDVIAFKREDEQEGSFEFSIPEDLLMCKKIIKDVEELIERSEL